MKKIISILLSLVFVFSLTACSNNTVSIENDNLAQSNNVLNSDEDQTDLISDNRTLVVFYSATGSTKSVAKAIAETLNADIFEIIPQEPYTSEDLNWSNSNSRVSVEHNDESKRTVPLEKTTPADWEQYDTVYIGYPIWWGIAAWPVDEFIAGNDFTDKTVVPFCTSASSELGNSGKLLEAAAGTGDWLEGKRFSSNVSQKEVKDWVSETIN